MTYEKGLDAMMSVIIDNNVEWQSIYYFIIIININSSKYYQIIILAVGMLFKSVSLIVLSYQKTLGLLVRFLTYETVLDPTLPLLNPSTNT